MNMHSAWKKNQKREIRKTLSRYLAIVTIIALGVGFFSGLKITRNAMVKTADTYIADCDMYDEQLISTLGLSDDDVVYLKGLDGVKYAEGAFTADFIADIDNGTECVLEAHSITDNINLLSLTAGRMPEADDECVVDARYFTTTDIGNTIRVSVSNNEDTTEKFAYSEYTIVGLTDSVCYLNRMERGTTSLSDGKISAFLYLPKGGFSLECYTEIYVTLLAGDGEIFSNDYESAVSEMEQPLTDALEQRAQLRYQDIIQKAGDEISDAEIQYNKALAEYYTQKSDVEQQLQEALAQLQQAQTQINANETMLSEREISLDAAASQYQSGLESYVQAMQHYLSDIADTQAQFISAQQEIDTQRSALETALSAATAANDDAQILVLQGKLALLDTAQNELDQKQAAAENEANVTETELANTKYQLDVFAQEIETARSELAAGQKELAEAKAEYADNLKQYETFKTESENQFINAEIELADAKTEIDNAKADLDKIDLPECYVLDRNTNIGYVCFDNDSSIVSGIAKVFPLFFFLVAALVCITTMTRMVEEQRTQIGTLKALGYCDTVILWKYLSYSASAAVAGAVIGYFGGIKLFPWVIWKAYSMLYDFAPIRYIMDGKLFVLSMAVSLFCSAGATYITCRTELMQVPAELMRTKAPKAGKRVLLERIPFLWNRFNFLRKISIRNIFRYKKRFFMMVLGISGCTALLLTALGIRDSISNIASDQFDNIMKYDFAITFDQAKTSQERNTFISETSSLLSKCVFVCNDTVEVPINGGIKTVNVIAAEDNGITDMIDLHYNGNVIDYPADGSVVISEKLAQQAGISPGDSITVKLSNSEECQLKVSNIFENYVYNYILMTANTYETVFGKECDYQNALAVSASADIHAVSAQLMNSYGAANISVSADIRSQVMNMMNSLNYVVLLVIGCAAALALVVLYNLSNINITERIREIATIKVLGFYAREVGAYVFRENIVLTGIGALLGVPFGIWLHRFVMSCINIDIVNFKVSIKPISFLLAITVTFVFTITVDLFMRRKLDKINMVESLKSIE